MEIGDRVRYTGPATGFKGGRRVIAVLGSCVEVEMVEAEDIRAGVTPMGRPSKSAAKRETRSCVYPVAFLERESA